MTRRSGTRVGLRTGFGWISTPVETLGPGTQFLLLLSETFSLAGRTLRPFFNSSRRKKSSGLATLVLALVGLALYPIMFVLFFAIVCGPWLVQYVRVKHAAALARRLDQQPVSDRPSAEK